MPACPTCFSAGFLAGVITICAVPLVLLAAALALERLVQRRSLEALLDDLGDAPHAGDGPGDGDDAPGAGTAEAGPAQAPRDSSARRRGWRAAAGPTSYAPHRHRLPGAGRVP